MQRLTAKKVRLVDLLRGKFFYGSKEDMKPSYIITPFGDKISRVNLIASVTEKFLSEDGNYSSITVDDGTESIRVKSFGEDIKILDGIEPGDLVTIIGKIREYNGEIYLQAEVVKKVEDVNFEVLRKLEILDILIEQKKTVKEIMSVAEQMPESELENYVKEKYGLDRENLEMILESKTTEIDYKPKVLEVIQSLDEGDGVEVVRLFEILNLPEHVIESTIDELLKEGALFEPKVGFLKKV
ncbi:MAG: OB-fold nucleic acid binding domain-containing protein [Candidatus Aenigmatarchaeota archaeon]